MDFRNLVLQKHFPTLNAYLAGSGFSDEERTEYLFKLIRKLEGMGNLAVREYQESGDKGGGKFLIDMLNSLF